MMLAEFVLARLVEKESAARAAGGGTWHALDGGVTDLDEETWPVTSTEAPAERQIRVHIALNDPARVLADCAAKRRIVESHSHSRNSYGCGDDCDAGCGPLVEYMDCGVCCEAREYAVQGGWCLTLRVLASVWADHSDYQEEWRP